MVSEMYASVVFRFPAIGAFWCLLMMPNFGQDHSIQEWNQRIPTLVPKVGHSVARVEITRDGQTEVIGGFAGYSEGATDEAGRKTPHLGR